MSIVPDTAEFGNQNIGTPPLSWGAPGVPLVPTSLRTRWADEPLPAWVSREIGLPDGSTVGLLGEVVVPANGSSDRIKNYFVLLLNSRIDSIRSVAVVDRAWPTHLSVDQVPWRRRTRNCLLNSDLVTHLVELPRISFGDLFDVPGMGALSVLDFACTLEAVLDFLAHEQGKIADDEGPSRVSAVLIRVLDEAWSDFVSERDPRFSDLMPVGKGTLTERIDDLTSNPESTLSGLGALASAAGLVRERIGDLERQSLEDSLRDYVSALSGVRDARLRAIVARLHLAGAPSAATQDEAGSLAGGLSRQRIQQLESKTTRRRPTHPVVMPALDAAVSALLRVVPLDVHAASRMLQREGITRGPFHPNSVIAAAAYTGRTSVLEVRRVYEKELVVAIGPERDVVDLVLKVARRQAAQAGASSVAQVADALARDNVELTEVRVGELLRLYGEAEFVAVDWFCFPLSPNDSLRSLTRKMLSVTTPLDVSSLRDGIRRAFRFKRSSTRGGANLPVVPPREILAGYYRAHPDFAISDDDIVRSVTPLDYRAELGPIEHVMVTVLRTAPARTLDRTSFSDACEERGVNLNTLWTLATYSPVIEHLGAGLWTLRGAVVDPATVEAFRKTNALRPRERRVVDYGWAQSGELWIATRLPARVESFVFGVPAAIGRFLAGRDFTASDLAGTACGTIRVYDGLHAGGTTQFLRRAGADEGDIMLVRFDLGAATALLSIIDDDALEELSPES